MAHKLSPLRFGYDALLVVDTGGWLPGRKVLISPRALPAIDWDGERINADVTTSEVEQSPNIDTNQPASRPPAAGTARPR